MRKRGLDREILPQFRRQLIAVGKWRLLSLRVLLLMGPPPSSEDHTCKSLWATQLDLNLSQKTKKKRKINRGHNIVGWTSKGGWIWFELSEYDQTILYEFLKKNN